MAFHIRNECIGCGACKKKCPWGAILGEKKQKHVIDPTLCRECGCCWYTCPKSVVEDPKGFCREKGVKRDLPKAAIDSHGCVGCQTCYLNCAQGAIEFKSGILTGHCKVNQDECKSCGNCLEYCVNDCIELV